ncbi:MAG: hypothetical protein B7Z39_01400 [Novosphingobium sp. 12-64-8]|nr:MAG: hypothetical protein B7Z39_01400 [Novosphingobium sp. 12-64-8]
MKRFTLALIGAALFVPANARADEDLCVNRPGINTPTCTLERGQVMVEVGLAGWDHIGDGTSRSDTVSLGDTVFRAGLGRSTEVQIGLPAWVHQRDRTGPAVQTASGIGDVTIAVRHGFGNEGDAPFALQAFVTLPTGRSAIGAGDWGAGLIAPLALDLPSDFQLAFSPEVDAAVNASGSGRHLAWGGAVGLSHPLTSKLSFTAEVAAYRDEDPAGHSTDARVAGSLAWRAGKSLQIDLEVDKGIASGAPERSIMLGIARQFR